MINANTRTGAPADIRAAITDLRSTARRRIDAAPRPVEIYVWMVLGGFLGSFGVVVRDTVQAVATNVPRPPGAMMAAVAGSMVSAFVLVPVVVMALAVPTWLLCRACGGTGSLRDTQAAAGWAALLASMLYLGGSLLAAGVLLLSEPTATLPRALVELLLFVIGVRVWAICIAQAHGFASHRALFWGALGLVGAVIGLLGWSAMGGVA